MVQRYSFNMKKQNNSLAQKALGKWSFFDSKFKSKYTFKDRNSFNIFMKIREFFS